MSIALMTEVWRLDLPTTDKMVLLALADAANDDGVTWMALESQEGVKLDLIKKTSLSRRAVQGALKRLVDTGYLSRVDRPGKGVIWTVKGCTSCAPQEMRPAADAPGGAARAPKPSNNHQPLSEANASSRDAGATKETDFDQFWRAYPAKVGKKAAQIAWKRAKDRPPIADVLSAIDRYRRAKPQDRDWCHPATWINQGRWADEFGDSATGPPVVIDMAEIERRRQALIDHESQAHA